MTRRHTGSNSGTTQKRCFDVEANAARIIEKQGWTKLGFAQAAFAAHGQDFSEKEKNAIIAQFGRTGQLTDNGCAVVKKFLKTPGLEKAAAPKRYQRKGWDDPAEKRVRTESPRGNRFNGKTSAAVAHF